MNKLNIVLMRRTAVAVLAAIALVGSASAQGPGGPGGGPGPGGPGGLGRMLSGMLGTALGLTDAQKTQIQTIMDQSKTAMSSLSSQLTAARDAEKAAIKAGKSDAELAQLAQSYSALHVQVHAIRLQTESKIYQVLTPEQRAKLDEVQQQMRDRVLDRANGLRQRPGAGQ